MGAGGVAVAGSLRGAAEPVFGARLAERHLRDALDLGEVLGGGLRIVQELKGVPAGVELGLGDVGAGSAEWPAAIR